MELVIFFEYSKIKIAIYLKKIKNSKSSFDKQIPCPKKIVPPSHNFDIHGSLRVRWQEASVFVTVCVCAKSVRSPSARGCKNNRSDRAPLLRHYISLKFHTERVLESARGTTAFLLHSGRTQKNGTRVSQIATAKVIWPGLQINNEASLASPADCCQEK